ILAAAALDALVHRAPELVVDGRAFEVDGAHRSDAAARGGDLQSRDAIRRAVRETEPAGDAGDELVSAEVQHGGPDVGHDFQLSARIGTRPGFMRPSGSSASLTRAITSTFGSGTPNPSRPGAPVSRSSQPSAPWAIARASASDASVSAATCTVPTPASPSQAMPSSPSRRPTASTAPGGTEIRPRCGPAG